MREDMTAAPIVVGYGARSDKVKTSIMNAELADDGIEEESALNSSSIQIRKNLNETAFFYPQLATNENGEVVLKFKAPEALTRWKMMGPDDFHQCTTLSARRRPDAVCR